MVTSNAIAILLAGFLTYVAGYQMYNYQTEFCCDGKVVDGSQYNSCCGSEPYSDEEQACCDGKLQAFPLENAKHYACCGSTVYSQEQEDVQCCNGVLQTVEDPTKEYICCGSELYDAETYDCCGETGAFTKVEDFACCGSEVYYLTTMEVCCSTDDAVDGTVKAVTYPRSDGKTECCGLQNYDFRQEVCCDDEVVPKPDELGEEDWGVCCGGVVITDHENQLCCDDVAMTRNSTDYSCCGEKLFNHVTETCCGKEILEGASTRECCPETETSYDPATEACCGTTVETLSDDEVTGLFEKNACCSATSEES